MLWAYRPLEIFFSASLYVKIYRRLTYKDGPCAERVKALSTNMVVVYCFCKLKLLILGPYGLSKIILNYTLHLPMAINDKQ